MKKKLIVFAVLVTLFVGWFIWSKVTWAERKVKKAVSALEEVCTVVAGPLKGAELVGRVNRFGKLFGEELVMDLQEDSVISNHIEGRLSNDELRQIFGSAMTVTKSLSMDIDYDEVKKVDEVILAEANLKFHLEATTESHKEAMKVRVELKNAADGKWKISKISER